MNLPILSTYIHITPTSIYLREIVTMDLGSPFRAVLNRKEEKLVVNLWLPGLDVTHLSHSPDDAKRAY